MKTNTVGLLIRNPTLALVVALTFGTAVQAAELAGANLPDTLNAGDSGSDALLGSFKGMTCGGGPVLSYVRQIGKTQLLAELKWLPELDVNKRMEGDYVWFKLGFLF